MEMGVSIWQMLIGFQELTVGAFIWKLWVVGSNLFGDKGAQVTSGEKGLGKVDGVEVVRVDADTVSLMAKEKGMEHLVDEGWQVEKW